MSTDIPLDASPVTWSINIMKAHSSQAITFNLEAASTLYLLTWPEPGGFHVPTSGMRRIFPHKSLVYTIWLNENASSH